MKTNKFLLSTFSLLSIANSVCCTNEIINTKSTLERNLDYIQDLKEFFTKAKTDMVGDKNLEIILEYNRLTTQIIDTLTTIAERLSNRGFFDNPDLEDLNGWIKYWGLQAQADVVANPELLSGIKKELESDVEFHTCVTDSITKCPTIKEVLTKLSHKFDSEFRNFMIMLIDRDYEDNKDLIIKVNQTIDAIRTSQINQVIIFMIATNYILF